MGNSIYGNHIDRMKEIVKNMQAVRWQYKGLLEGWDNFLCVPVINNILLKKIAFC